MECIINDTIENSGNTERVILRAKSILESDSSSGKRDTISYIAEKLNTTAITVKNVRAVYAQSGIEEFGTAGRLQAVFYQITVRSVDGKRD